MARGPFQGTYSPYVRPTVVTAPDALVYINGESDLIGCPSCQRKFDLNKYITSIQVNLSVDSPGAGSANISLSIPRHTIDDFYVDGTPIVGTMMEVEIYAKGFFLLEGLPQYYPIFWGLITEVSNNYSSGEHTVDIQCSDILKWWELCRMNINAAFTAPTPNQGRSVMGNTFFGTNPYDVIWTLAQSSFGDVVIGTGSLINFDAESDQKQTFKSSFHDMVLYWERRFRRIRSNLMLYGISGVAVRGATLYESMGRGKGPQDKGHYASTEVLRANGGKDAGQAVFNNTDPGVTAFRTQFGNAGQVNFWQSEYQTKLELANAAKAAIGYEFYMDVTGDIVFKPPFYNLDILGNKPISWIQDIDIIDWGFSDSEAEVVTQLTMQGSFGGNVEYGLSEEATPYTTVTDYHLLRKYGWRSEPYNSEFMGNPQDMFYHGLDILDIKNSKRHHGTVTIPMRTELRLGFPIYIAPLDQIWYIAGINHNIAFGGRATTQLTLTAKRGKFLAPQGISRLKYTGRNKAARMSAREVAKSGSYELTYGKAASIPPVGDVADGKDNPYAPLIMRHPKTGRIVGYPNVVMVYTRPFKAPSDEVAKRGGQSKDGQKKAVPKAKQPVVKQHQDQNLQTGVGAVTVSDYEVLQAKHSNNSYQYGLNSAGVYVYAYDADKTIGELVLLTAGNIKYKGGASDAPKDVPGATKMIRPVSDERGFEVVGHFRYGRGVSLRDGQLVIHEGANNETASVDVQLALSGGLAETLAAQSQGITTITSTFANAADTITRMQPEDTQTAGIVNPDTKQPEFVSTGNNFVDAAPLGSDANKGQPASVEASQLSRALTIAEMSAAKDIGDDDDAACACVTGRADLAFINVGYQVKTISTSSTASPISINAGDVADTTRPLVVATTVKSNKDQLGKVDTFLWNLYSALDGPHHTEETILRTGVATPVDAQDDTTGPTTPPFGELTPPFSAPGRYAIGDPKAFLGSLDSNVKGLDKAFSTIGENIKQGSKRAELTQRIANEEGNIKRLEAEKATIQGRLADKGNTTVGDQQGRLNQIEAELSDTKQKLTADQIALQQLGSG